ncbi:isoprenoid synthase domain-containing protein [Mycena rebaudengoi]|nr:isoprenoid synthase domain-containing protein [Mycena rebaudengoi]KAJ7275627.1 isoprenoid synthase domain-containing protein [Mycena rebaudengoi]
MYAWFFFYVDDLSAQPFLEDFQRRILLGLPQEHIPLANFHKVLGTLYKYWDPINANSMVCAAMEFVSGTVLEERKEITEMMVQPSASQWARYLRTKSGMAPGFSSTAFPRSAHPDISVYIQALPDIEEYLCFVNDILSFYKEDLAGETMTYVQIRAKTSQKHPKRVLAEMVQETGDLHRRIDATLAGNPNALKSWKTLEYGFIGWHLSLERYKLAQLGLNA